MSLSWCSNCFHNCPNKRWGLCTSTQPLDATRVARWVPTPLPMQSAAPEPIAPTFDQALRSLISTAANDPMFRWRLLADPVSCLGTRKFGVKHRNRLPLGWRQLLGLALGAAPAGA